MITKQAIEDALTIEKIHTWLQEHGPDMIVCDISPDMIRGQNCIVANYLMHVFRDEIESIVGEWFDVSAYNVRYINNNNLIRIVVGLPGSISILIDRFDNDQDHRLWTANQVLSIMENIDDYRPRIAI